MNRRALLAAAVPAALALPAAAFASVPPAAESTLDTIRARFEDLWQELMALPGDISPAQHQSMFILFDRMSAIVGGRAPLEKSPTLLDALRKLDKPVPADDAELFAAFAAWQADLEADWDDASPEEIAASYYDRVT